MELSYSPLVLEDIWQEVENARKVANAEDMARVKAWVRYAETLQK